MKTNVRSYTDKQILERVANVAKGFKHYPAQNVNWLIGVRSQEDAYNIFDDKFYHFKGVDFQSVSVGTTNAGARGLKHHDTYNKDGCAVLQADRIVYNSHIRGISKGRIVYRQNKPWPYFRDDNKNEKAEEIGFVHLDIIYAHIHDVKLEDREVFKKYINGNSLACQVFAKGENYDEFMKITEDQKFLTYCLLNEWDD